jgi:hypothetical protein
MRKSMKNIVEEINLILERMMDVLDKDLGIGKEGFASKFDDKINRKLNRSKKNLKARLRRGIKVRPVKQ